MMGHTYMTYSLFFETHPTHSQKGPYYTLKDREHRGLPSMKQLYMSCKDLTEYDQAILLLGSWDHWVVLSKSAWFAKKVEAWHEELEIKLRSEAIRKMVESDRPDAAKWIAERKWESKRGRPSKEEVTREKRIHAGIGSEVDELYNAAHEKSETRPN